MVFGLNTKKLVEIKKARIQNPNKLLYGACEFGVNKPNSIVNSSNRLLTKHNIP